MMLVLDELSAHAHAFWFLEPVDPVALRIPTYPEIVKEPMDLSTLRSRLLSGVFDSEAAEFGRQSDLIFSNSILFNPASTLVHQNSLEMRRDAAKVLKRLVPEAFGIVVDLEDDDADGNFDDEYACAGADCGSFQVAASDQKAAR
jgi:hypothetical protein